MKSIKKFFAYFSKGERILWSASVVCTIVSFCIFDRTSYAILCASLVGVTALIFNAKGNPFGQVLIVAFSILYGAISFKRAYYGEMLTYVGMSMPMAIYALIAWIKHPYQGNKSEVKINAVRKKEGLLVIPCTLLVVVVFYFILRYFNTANLVVSTISVGTSFLAVYFSARRSPLFALSYAFNDVVLIVLWGSACFDNARYISMVVCFLAFLANDLYSFINWQRIKKRQAAGEASLQEAQEGTEA